MAAETADRPRCPVDASHFEDAHAPGGAWYGVPHSASTEELPAVVRRVADQIARGVRLFSDPEAVAAVICSSGDIAAGLAALPMLEQLRARHAKRVWGDTISQFGRERPVREIEIVVCDACNVAWPCPDAEILGVE